MTSLRTYSCIHFILTQGGDVTSKNEILYYATSYLYGV